jgi:hypothetical protein
MGRINYKPTRWGMILAAFGRQQKGIIFTPESERLARLKILCPPKEEKEKKPEPPKRWLTQLWRNA